MSPSHLAGQGIEASIAGARTLLSENRDINGISELRYQPAE